MKNRIFIDFWNFQLTLNEVAPEDYRLDWKKISPWLVDQAEKIISSPLQYEGTHVYMSYDPRKEADRQLRNFALNTLARFPGMHVDLFERKSKGPPKCPSCYQEITDCPHCGNPIARTIEKGVDTAIVTDLCKLAWEGA